MLLVSLLSLSLAALGQQIGTQQAEVHPPITTYTCDSTGSCNPDAGSAVVLDANWRWTHKVSVRRSGMGRGVVSSELTHSFPL